jgi:hypothetical protein
MILRHATPARHVNSILRRGLLKAKSKGKRAAVWLCTACNAMWAAYHTVGRHGGRIEGVVVLEVDVPRSWLRRHRKGLYYVPRDIPPERIRGAATYGKLSAAPAA